MPKTCATRPRRRTCPEPPTLTPCDRAFRIAGGSGTDGRTKLATQSLALQLRAKRSEMMIAELEDVALRLFEERGFGDVTVEDIASEAHISVRTFYRYFSTKEDVLQLPIDRRTEGLRAALSVRPVDESPLHSLRLALEEVVSAEDT